MRRLFITAILVSTLVTTFVTMLSAAPVDSSRAWRIYRERYADQLPEMVSEAIRYPTVFGNTAAQEQQKTWLKGIAQRLGFTYRDAGKVVEIELTGPQITRVVS